MLLLGKQFTKNDPNRIGGVIKLFEIFKDELDNAGIEYDIIDLNWRNYHNPMYAYLYIVFCIAYKTPKHTVISFHGTANEFIYLAPLVVFLGRSLNKKLCLRKFAGNFDKIFKKSGIIRKYLVVFSLKYSDCVFFETLHLVNFFSRYNQHTYWFPNVRHTQSIRRTGPYLRNFIFVGQVKKTKGIYQALEAFNAIGDSFSIDFYGPLEDEDFSNKCEDIRNVNYKGVLSQDMVAKTISEYDVLVLPTFHPGEGYPGVILEAFSVGVPVIATNWGGIPEIIHNGENGYLVEPMDVEGLIRAILSINASSYNQLSHQALHTFKDFDSRHVTIKSLKIMESM